MTAYEMRISDWSSDVCSSDLRIAVAVNARLDIVLDLRLQIGTEDIEGEFGNRLPRDAAVDAIFVDAAKVAIQVAIGHRIIGRGQAIVVLGEPARHLRLHLPGAIAHAEIEIVRRFRLGDRTSTR